MTCNTVIDLLASTNPREHAGSQTAGRYRFQANFGILKLIELCQTDSDFRIVFDLFDDVMVLNCSENPTQIQLYQVKSKDPGVWSSSNLCTKTGANKPRSIVSRLYAHLEMFGDALVETSLITNAAYRLKLLDETTSSGTHHHITGNALHSDEIAKITKAVNDDFSSSDIPAWLPKLVFIRITLGVHGQEAPVIGHLQQFIEENYGGQIIKTSALYQTLLASIEHRTAYSQQNTKTIELLTRKSITRSEVDELMDRAINRRRSLLEDWSILQADFAEHSIGSRRQIQIKTAVTKYLSDRNSGRASVSQISRNMREWATRNISALADCETIIGMAKLLRAALPSSLEHSDLELDAAALVEAHEASYEAAQLEGPAPIATELAGKEEWNE